MKNILITGGSSGLGNELVRLFSDHCDYSVVTCSRDKVKKQILA